MKCLLALCVALFGTIVQAQEKAAVKAKLIKPASAVKRINYLSQAQVWKSQNIEALDLIAGPTISNAFQFDESIKCQYSKSGRLASNGNSRKFECLDNNQKKLKIKYTITEQDLTYFSGLTDPNPKAKGRKFLASEQLVALKDQTNKEVFAEVAATRLLWALGFGVDNMYAVQVSCVGCPLDPMEGVGPGLNAPMSFVSRYAAIERKLPALEIGMKEDQGWTWEELEANAGVFPAANEPANKRVHYEALKLVAAFIQHGDRKAEQQRLVCEQTTTKDLMGDSKGIFAEQNEPVCTSTLAYIHDLGATFGGAGSTTNGNSAKMNLKQWSGKSVFNEALYQKTKKVRNGVENGVCRATLGISMAASGGMGDPLIREEGRAFLGELLKRFRDAGKVKDLFRVSRVEGVGDTVEAWEMAFNNKVDQILSKTCCVPNALGDACLNN